MLQDIASLIQNFGLAVAILLVLGLFLWRLLVWLKPWIEKLITAHLAFVSSTSAAVEKISETVDELKSLHADTANKLGDLVTSSKRASDLLQKMSNNQQTPGESKGGQNG